MGIVERHEERRGRAEYDKANTALLPRTDSPLPFVVQPRCHFGNVPIPALAMGKAEASREELAHKFIFFLESPVSLHALLKRITLQYIIGVRFSEILDDIQLCVH